QADHDRRAARARGPLTPPPDESPPAMPTALSRPPMTDAPIRVLLAEDDADARHLLTDLLVAFGHEVVRDVASGRDAVSAARELAPDAVLLDVHMPDGSGIEAAEEIVHAAPRTAIVLFSGDQSVE